MQEADRLSAWGGRGLPCAQIGALLVHPPHQYPGPQRSGPPGSRWGWGQRGAACSGRPGAAPPQPGLSRQGRGGAGRPCRTPGPFNSSLAPTRARGQRASRTPTVALASAALAFFSRALQASKSRRRFWRSRLSFCGGENRDQADAGQPWEAPGRSGMAMATGPSGRHRRTGPDRGVDHARPLGAPGPQQGRPQEGEGPAQEEREPGLGGAEERAARVTSKAAHRNGLPVPFQEVAQGREEIDGGRVDKIPLRGSQALLRFCHLDQRLP